MPSRYVIVISELLAEGDLVGQQSQVVPVLSATEHISQDVIFGEIDEGTRVLAMQMASDFFEANFIGRTDVVELAASLACQELVEAVGDLLDAGPLLRKIRVVGVLHFSCPFKIRD